MLFGNRGGSAIDYIIVGLGNPGSKYFLTRHNIGFMAIDELAKRLGVSLNKKAHSSVCAKAVINGKKCLIMQPQTYMNNSGEAVAAAAKFYKVPSERIIVIFDDISLDVGKMRIRRKGSDGGHNGIKSICCHIDDNFPRIKLGVGAKPNPDYDLASWVLSKFRSEDMPKINDTVCSACDAVELMVNGEIDKAMNLFNS